MAAAKISKLLLVSFLLNSTVYTAEPAFTAHFILTDAKSGILQLVAPPTQQIQANALSTSISTHPKTDSYPLPKPNTAASPQKSSSSYVMWNSPKTPEEIRAFDERIANCNMAVQEAANVFNKKPQGNDSNRLKKFYCNALKKMNEVLRGFEDFLNTLPGEAISEKKQITFGQAGKDPSKVTDTTEISYRFQEEVLRSTHVESLVQELMEDIQYFFNILKASTHLTIIINHQLVPYINKESLHRELLKKGQELPLNTDATRFQKYHQILLQLKAERDTSLKRLMHQITSWFVPEYAKIFNGFQNNWITLSTWDPNVYDKMIDSAYQQLKKIEDLSAQLSAIKALHELRQRYVPFLLSREMAPPTNEVPEDMKVFRKKLIDVLTNFVKVFDSTNDWKSSLRNDLQYIEKELKKLNIDDLKKLYGFHNITQSSATEKNGLIKNIKKTYEDLSLTNSLHAKILFLIDWYFILGREKPKKAFHIFYDISYRILLNSMPELQATADRKNSSAQSLEEIDQKIQDIGKLLDERKQKIMNAPFAGHPNAEYEKSLRLLYFKYQKEILVYKAFYKILPFVLTAVKDELDRRMVASQQQQKKEPSIRESADKVKQDLSTTTSVSQLSPSSTNKKKDVTPSQPASSSSSSPSTHIEGSTEPTPAKEQKTQQNMPQEAASPKEKSTYDALRMDNDKLKREIEILRTELALQQKSSALTTEQILKLSEDNERLHNEKQEAILKKEQYDSILKTKELELNNLRAEIAKLKKQLQTAEKNNSEAQTSNKSSLAKISELNRRIEESTLRIKQLETDSQALMHEKDKLASILEVTTRLNSQAMAEIKILREKGDLVDKQQTELSLLKMFNAQLQQEARKLKIENAGLSMAIEDGDFVFQKMSQFFGPVHTRHFFEFMTQQNNSVKRS